MTKSQFINHFKCANCRRNHSIGKMRWNTRCCRQENDALDTLWNDFLWHRRRAPCTCGVLWQRFLLTKCSSSTWADIEKYVNTGSPDGTNNILPNYHIHELSDKISAYQLIRLTAHVRIYQQTRFNEPEGSGGTDRLRSYRQNPKRTDSV